MRLSHITSEKPRTALRGVRNSWLMFARNFSFAFAGRRAMPTMHEVQSAVCRSLVAGEDAPATAHTLADALAPEAGLNVYRNTFIDALVFWGSAMSHLANWQTTLELFATDYQVPILPPELAAYMAVAIEVTTPVVLVLDLLTCRSSQSLASRRNVSGFGIAPASEEEAPPSAFCGPAGHEPAVRRGNDAAGVGATCRPPLTLA
jgi:DoxX